MDMQIRNATTDDLKEINDIYNHYVLNSTCTYQTEIETIEDRINWFEEHGEDYPVIVALIDEEIAGWASISKYHKRAAYKPTVENSVYIKDCFRGKGIGSALLSKTIELSRQIGYHSIIAEISGDQTASINLHIKYGFQKTAHLKDVGYKFGRWLDVVFYQLIL